MRNSPTSAIIKRALYNNNLSSKVISVSSGASLTSFLNTSNESASLFYRSNSLININPSSSIGRGLLNIGGYLLNIAISEISILKSFNTRGSI